MFKVFCERHATEVLLGYDNIVSITNMTDVVEMEWECYCGQHGRHVSAHRHTTAA